MAGQRFACQVIEVPQVPSGALMALGLLRRDEAGGRSTAYVFEPEP